MRRFRQRKRKRSLLGEEYQRIGLERVGSSLKSRQFTGSKKSPKSFRGSKNRVLGLHKRLYKRQ